MSGYYDRLQGTDRLLRIRRLRKALFAAIVALSVLLVVARMGSQGASIKPLFLPVNGIIEIALIMGFVTAIVGLFLRNLEIRHAQRDGQRYLMAKSSMARAIRTAGFAIGLAVVLLLAVTPSLTASLFSDAQQVVPLASRAREVVTFTSPDPLGFSFVTHAAVVVTQGHARVTLLRNNVTLATADLNATQGDTLDVEPRMWEGYASWSLVFQNELASDTYLTFVLEKGVVPTLFSTVPFLLFLYGGTQVAWWIVLRPIRDRTKAGSLSVAADVDESERVYDDTVQSPNPDTNPGPQPAADPDIFNIAAASTPAIEVEAPPPPVRSRVPAPPPRVETPKPAPRPVVRQPETAASLAAKAGALVATGTYDAALAVYEEALRLDPGHAVSLDGRASCLVRLNQKIEEVRVDVPGLLSRALIASASGNYPQALNLFDDILEVEPSNVNALIGKAVAYRRSGKPQEAVNCLDLVLGVQPNNASALLNRGNILLAEGDLENALDAFDHLTKLYPNDEEAWAAQGDVLVKMGRDDDALRAYTEALQRSPGDEGIQRRILELEAAKTAQPDIFEDLVGIKGIGKTRAKALIDAGFQSAEDFAKASLKDLMVVKGITRKIAEDLTEHFRGSLAEAR